MNKVSKFELLQQDKIFNLLGDSYKNFVYKQNSLSFQQLRQLSLMFYDLTTWQISFDDYLIDNFNFKDFAHFYELIRSESLNLSEGNAKNNEITVNKKEFPLSVLGFCPVNSPKTRCCGLYTLDVAQGCGFGCAYCAIPSFYDGEGKVTLPINLAEILANLKLDKTKRYHIGSGQASDSLLYTGREDTKLLIDFARQNSNVILELKSKSSNIHHFLNYSKLPNNIIFSWSLNPQPVINSWEAGTASLSQRLEAAQVMATKAKIGFHLHPIIPYQNYLEDYRNLVKSLIDNFKPQDIVMLSLGTLTFSKANLKHLRLKRPSNIYKLPLVETAGKYGLPYNLKLEMFKNIYNYFPNDWRQQVYFYLCMEDEQLWPVVFGYSYANNECFEEAMLSFYFNNINKNEPISFSYNE
ncbi:MAG: DNA photolyase [Spirochaetaceae bacterium]|nr:DNA photolyase [Spirochaetaceae bacterium]